MHHVRVIGATRARTGRGLDLDGNDSGFSLHDVVRAALQTILHRNESPGRALLPTRIAIQNFPFGK